jgi:lipoic acid synthetase
MSTKKEISAREQRAIDKVSRIPVKVIPINPIKKPDWIRVKLSTVNSDYVRIRQMISDKKLHTVCQSASCPNMGECFGKGTATFMIMGDKCTRRCPFCDVSHGKPEPLDKDEPSRIADAVSTMRLRYVVMTSVTRDDLRDGGASHFAACTKAIHDKMPDTKVEILTPDFRGREDAALQSLAAALPDVMNHNLETVPRLYQQVRPGADYEGSLRFLQRFHEHYPDIPTKSGLMVGLGETDEEILAVMRDLRVHGVSILTIGQYLQPTVHHHGVIRYVTPDTFAMFKEKADEMGFAHAAIGPLVRSSYHADHQAEEAFKHL